jgi:serine/threonine protein kinase
MAESCSPADFWRLLATSGLLTPERVEATRHEFEGRHPDAAAIATRLCSHGLLTAWQSRQLLKGRTGPFFLGDYRLTEQHKTPYRGRRFSARHEPSGRDVSLVVLETEACEDSATWESIKQATRQAASVCDPVTTRTWALEQAGRRRLIVCEHVAGTPLIETFAETGSRPLAATGGIVLAVARAVAELHRLGIVHGGISLHTILACTPAPRTGDVDAPPVRLLQFPLAGDPHVHPPRLPLGDARQLEALGERICFAAPELATPGAEATATSDVYSLGCVLAALLTGRLPNWDGTVSGTLATTRQQGLATPRTTTLPPEVRAAIDYMTAIDPLQRYASAVEAAAAVAACFGLPEFPIDPPATAPVANGKPSPHPLEISTDKGSVTTATRRRRRTAAARSRRMQTVVLGIAAVALAVAGAAGIWLTQRDGGEQAVAEKTPGESAPETAPAPREAGQAADAATGRRQLLVDDATLPWASPTDGSPPALDYLPQGSQLILMARPAELFADAEGRRLVQALGPQVESLLAEAERLSGVPPAQLIELRVGWRTTAAGTGQVGIVLVADQAFEATSGAAWASWPRQTLDGETIREGPNLSGWLPSSAEGRVLVLGPVSALEESIANSGVTLIAPDVERLLEALDSKRQLTLIGSPSFLRNEGQLVLSNQLAAPAAAIADLLGEQTTFAACSLFLGETCYLEIDAVPITTVPTRRLADDMAAELNRLPDVVEQHCLGLMAGGYGGRLIGRLPGMLRVVAAKLRWGEEDGLAVLNTHLPREAAHNIALASELALAQEPGGAAVAAAPTAPATPLTIEEKLAVPVSLVFAKDTLEKSVEMLAVESGIPMEILGGDLQLEGITKNQSFGLDQQQQPVDAILRTILQQANPDGKLVYVIRGEGANASLVITTRAAVAKRGETLPAGFAEP